MERKDKPMREKANYPNAQARREREGFAEPAEPKATTEFGTRPEGDPHHPRLPRKYGESQECLGRSINAISKDTAKCCSEREFEGPKVSPRESLARDLQSATVPLSTRGIFLVSRKSASLPVNGL